MKALAVVSGGMDSVTLAYVLKHREGCHVDLVSFDYGQRHVREIRCAEHAAAAIGGEHLVATLPIGFMLQGSALTDRRVPVPEGHYADDTMRSTVVPNRNMILLSVAVGIAVARGADLVATGVHAGDHPIYPDCRPEFIEEFDRTARLANRGFAVDGFRVEAPFVYQTKADIVRIGHALGVPWEHTWSCYQGGRFHCGRCGTCVERREAFEIAGVDDPTEYERQRLVDSRD